jgi:hypothetical protein
MEILEIPDLGLKINRNESWGTDSQDLPLFSSEDEELILEAINNLLV